jgi:peptidyl-prolyl cis-trans isomerase SurA
MTDSFSDICRATSLVTLLLLAASPCIAQLKAPSAPAAPATTKASALRLTAAPAPGGVNLLRTAAASTTTASTPPSSATANGDYIVAIVNQDVVTASELRQRMARIRQESERSRASLPPPAELQAQVLDLLINERVQVTHARENSPPVSEAELDRAMAALAAQNQITTAQLLERLQREGLSVTRFRSNLRDQIQTERVREREVQERIRITDADIDAFLQERQVGTRTGTQINLAQILVSLPDNASQAQINERRERTQMIQARIKAGLSFEDAAKAFSDDKTSAKDGGALGLRPADRLPDAFISTTKGLASGQTASAWLRTNAGFHLLKVIEQSSAKGLTATQTRVRHILLKPSAQLSQELAAKRLADFKNQISKGARSFEQIAKENSEDGSAAQGGELGWVNPGTLVPEFEEAMNRLPDKALSDPVVSRFGVHLIQALERRQIEIDRNQAREQARNALREQKFEVAFADWIRDLRARAYVELRPNQFE